MDLIEVPLGFTLGDTFKTTEEFDAKLVTACKNKYVQFYKRDSLTISAAAKKVKRYLNADLKFYKIQYCCIHGGREFKTAGTGKRNKKTFRGVQLCPATVTIRVASSGQDFELVALNMNHNHPIDPVLFRHLPHQRKLPKELREEAKRLLQLKGNKHLIRQKLEEESHTVIKLKDLNNLRQEDRVQYRNNIESSVKKINEKFESECHLLIDHDNVFKGLMFATPTMKNAMKAYPEILCLDATYKLLNIRAPVYLILIEDGDGESQVVAVGILLSEDHESLKWFLEAFKDMNPSWINTKNIMADKDLNEREVLKLCFPQAQTLICLFHVFKIFQREITTEKMKITSLERNRALELLQKITFSKNIEEFEKIKLEISNSLSQVVVRYLDQHWVDIRDEWCPYLGEKILNLMNRTNNRVENLNAKLKAVITKNSTLEEFLEHLFVILKSLEKERQNRLAEKINKRPTVQYKKNSPECSYLNYVSEYAFQKVLSQLNNKTKVKVSYIDANHFIVVRNTDKEDDCEKQRATQNTCDCYFYNSMGLPCKHIFCVRDYLKLELFEETLVNQRWTKHYILQNQHFFQSLSDQALLTTTPEDFTSLTNSIDILSPVTQKVYSQQDKYKKAFSKCKLIATLCCEASGKRFENVMSALDDFIFLLESNNHSMKVISRPDEQFSEGTNSDVESQNWNEIISVESLLDENSLCEDTVSTISGNNRCTPVNVEINSSCLNEVNFSENIPATQEIIIEDNTETPIIVNLEYESDAINVENIGDDRNLYLKDKRTLPSLLQEHTEHNLENMEVESDSNLYTTLEISNLSNHEETMSNSLINLNEIKLPPVLKKRGRPSGSDRTVIGLPSASKRKKKDSTIPFNKIKNTDRANILLKWIVTKDTNVFEKKILDESNIKNLEDIDIRLAEVNLTLIKKFFTAAAFQQLISYKTWKKTSRIRLCNICTQNVNSNDSSIRCDRCLHWMHLTCVNGQQKECSLFFCGKCDI